MRLRSDDIRCSPNPTIIIMRCPNGIGGNSEDDWTKITTYRRFLLGICHPANNAVFLYTITLFKSMLMVLPNLIASGATGSGSIDTLYRVESLLGGNNRSCGLSIRHCASNCRVEWLLGCGHDMSIHFGQDILRTKILWSRLQVEMALDIFSCSASKEFCDLNLYVAEVTFPRNSLPLLLVRIVRFGCACWPSFQPAVEVMWYKRFCLVFLRRSMWVDVVNMREICLKSGPPSAHWIHLQSNEIWHTHFQ